MVTTIEKPETTIDSSVRDLGRISWSELMQDYNVPVLHRYGIQPEMLSGEVEREFNETRNKIKGTVVFNDNFVVAKLAFVLADTGLEDQNALEELVGEAVQYRVREAKEAKDAEKNEVLARLAKLSPEAAKAARKFFD